MRLAGATRRAGLVALLCALFASAALAGPLVPAPQHLQTRPGTLHFGRSITIGVVSMGAARSADRFAASTLVGELAQIEHVSARVTSSDSATIVLARADSAFGRRILRQARIGFPAAAAAEGYVLSVTPRQAVVVAESAAGEFYGVQTLRQWIHPAPGGAEAPAALIQDWPVLRWRAVQIDLSRGAIPTLAAFKSDLDLLSELKINAFVLYFENTFQYKAFPVFSAPGGAIDAAEARQIVAYAQPRHITVIPEQESFGHLHLGLQEERYQNLDELPYGDVLAPGVPGSLDMIGTMFAELAPVFPGPFFHIGADETAELGEGRSQPMLEKEGAGPLYLNYLKAIAQRLAPYHRKILFWGDIAQAHPELLHELPKDMIAVPWQYNPRPSYDSYIKPFTDAGLETWVAPAVWNFSRIFPDYSQAIPNIEGFVRDGRRLGATGVLNTTWNDDGESMFNFCWYGIAYGAAAGWQENADPAAFAQAYDWALFRADGHVYADQIADFTQIHTLLLKAIHVDGTDRMTWHEAFSPRGQQVYDQIEPVSHQVRLLAEDVIASLADHDTPAQDGARRNQELLDPVAFAARRFDFLGQKAIYAHYIAQLYDAARAQPDDRALVERTLNRINSINGLLQDMRDHATSLEQQYRALWLESNTPYFLDNILLRYQLEAQYWEREARRFTRISETYDRTHQLPPLIEHPPGS